MAKANSKSKDSATGWKFTNVSTVFEQAVEVFEAKEEFASSPFAPSTPERQVSIIGRAVTEIKQRLHYTQLISKYSHIQSIAREE